MIKQFVSPNLKHNNGKIYFLNKNELKNKDWKFINENYYYNIDETRVNFDECTIELIVNDYNDEILVKCNFTNNINENEVNNLFSKVNSGICHLEDSGECYNFVI
tara:strand:- start:126 stop:440 length:315 start_codon:yes stop_codon:yes gene_type:complete